MSTWILTQFAFWAKLKAKKILAQPILLKLKKLGYKKGVKLVSKEWNFDLFNLRVSEILVVTI